MVSKKTTKHRFRPKEILLSVPVSWKIIGISVLPVLILGLSLNYWVITGLSDWLSYFLTDARVEAAMAAGGRSVVFVTVIAAVLSIFLAFLFTYLLTSPLLELRKTAEKVASGSFDTRADIWANDEIGSLAISINQMIDNFVINQENLSLTNKQLALINKIALMANQKDEIHDVLYSILINVLEFLDLEYGWIYLYDPEIGKHHLASWHNVPAHLQDIFLREHPDHCCSCLSKLESGEMGEHVEVFQCERLTDLTKSENLSSHLTMPIVSGNVSLGLINFNYPAADSLDESTIGLLNSIGSQVSEIVANAWLQIKLREKEAARKLLLESLVTAQEAERQRLARELHDQAGQTLTNLLIRLKTIEHKSNEIDTKERINGLLVVVSETIEQIRDLSYTLRPPALDEFGLCAAVEALIEDMAKQAHIGFSCTCELERTIPSDIELVLYRIIQEGLTNVIRHAHADQVVVELKTQQQMVNLKIEDNGKGFNPTQLNVREGDRHLGLISISERAELVGGRFELFSSIGEGTQLIIQIPINQWE